MVMFNRTTKAIIKYFGLIVIVCVIATICLLAYDQMRVYYRWFQPAHGKLPTEITGVCPYLECSVAYLAAMTPSTVDYEVLNRLGFRADPDNPIVFEIVTLEYPQNEIFIVTCDMTTMKEDGACDPIKIRLEDAIKNNIVTYKENFREHPADEWYAKKFLNDNRPQIKTDLVTFEGRDVVSRTYTSCLSSMFVVPSDMSTIVLSYKKQ